MGTVTQPIPGDQHTADGQQSNLPATVQAPVTQVIPGDPLAMVSTAHSEQRDQIILMRAKFDYVQRMARMFAMSGCFADIKDTREDVAISKALVKIKLGESMGFSEAESMTGIDIIQGRVAVGASLRAARMQRAGFSWPQMVINDRGCWIPLCFQGKPMMCPKVGEDGNVILDAKGNPVMTQVIVSYTEHDAQKAGLLSKDNYRKIPSDMYFARAITRTQRRYGPGVLGVDVLDTYEARDLVEVPQRETATLSFDRLKPSTDENRGHGNNAAEPETPETKQDPPQETKPAESPAPPEPAQHKAPQVSGPQAQPKEPRERKTYSADNLPDAFDLRAGTEAFLVEGNTRKLIRVVEEDGEAPTWKTVAEEPVQQQETAEQPKQQDAPKQQNTRRTGRMF